MEPFAKLSGPEMAHLFRQGTAIACCLAAAFVARSTLAAESADAAPVGTSRTGTFTANAAEAPAGVPINATEKTETGLSSSALADLELFATELNQLFPPTGIWLALGYSRPGFEWRSEQVQKFTSNFQKTPEGNYEKPGFCETEWFSNGNSNGKTIETTIHRLTIEKDKVVLYAIHVGPTGTRNVYGPSPLAREGNALVFRDMNPGAVAGGNWIQSTFYRKRDGTLGSTRHWNAPYVDVWISQDPPSTTQ